MPALFCLPLILLLEIGVFFDQSLQKQAYVKSWLASIARSAMADPSN